MSPARDPVDLLVGSLKIYSPTSKESELAGFLADEMRGYGYRGVTQDAAGNVIGESGNGDRSLLLCGHMDTVPGDLPVRKEKDMIYGRGASDAKSPLCALLVAGAEAADSGMKVTFAGVTQEEGEGQGIDELIRKGTKFDYAVFGEPGSAQKITVGYRGRVSVHITVTTTGGHASSPWAHRSAFDEFSAVLAKLREYERSKGVPGDYFRSVSITPTLVRSGEFHNVVPERCEATLDLRVPPQTAAASAIADIRSLAESQADGVTVKVASGKATEAYEAATSSTLVRAFQRAILISLKSKPALVRKTGTGDMNTFSSASSAQCVTYGPGDPRTSHTDHESVDVGDYLSSIKVLGEAIRQLASLDSGNEG